MLSRLIGEGVQLLWHPAQALWPITMDPAQLDQVLANLCVNARDAVDGHGTVTVNTANCTVGPTLTRRTADAEPGEYARLTVHDNGSGMPPDVLERLFEPFFTTKVMGKGTGLGLATVYGIVRQHHGFLTVDSAPGAGTTFQVYLPRNLDRQETAGRPRGAVRPPTGRESILVVEDDPAVLQLVERALGAQGYQVTAALGPEAAIRHSSERPDTFDLLLTDVVMPGMSGVELARQLMAARPGLSLLYMSGYTADLIAEHGVIEADVAFLAKPFTLAELATAVRNALDGGG